MITIHSVKKDIENIANKIIKDLLNERLIEANKKDKISIILELILNDNSITPQEILKKVNIKKTTYYEIIKKIKKYGLTIRYYPTIGYVVEYNDNFSQ